MKKILVVAVAAMLIMAGCEDGELTIVFTAESLDEVITGWGLLDARSVTLVTSVESVANTFSKTSFSILAGKTLVVDTDKTIATKTGRTVLSAGTYSAGIDNPVSGGNAIIMDNGNIKIDGSTIFNATITLGESCTITLFEGVKLVIGDLSKENYLLESDEGTVVYTASGGAVTITEDGLSGGTLSDGSGGEGTRRSGMTAIDG
jgi:hypothetical protein